MVTTELNSIPNAVAGILKCTELFIFSPASAINTYVVSEIRDALTPLSGPQ